MFPGHDQPCETRQNFPAATRTPASRVSAPPWRARAAAGYCPARTLPWGPWAASSRSSQAGSMAGPGWSLPAVWRGV